MKKTEMAPWSQVSSLEHSAQLDAEGPRPRSAILVGGEGVGSCLTGFVGGQGAARLWVLGASRRGSRGGVGMKTGDTHVPSALSWAQRGGCSASLSAPRVGRRHSGPGGVTAVCGHCPAQVTEGRTPSQAPGPALPGTRGGGGLLDTPSQAARGALVLLPILHFSGAHPRLLEGQQRSPSWVSAFPAQRP